MTRLYFHEKVIQSLYHLDFYMARRREPKRKALLYLISLAVFIGIVCSIFNLRDFAVAVRDLDTFIESSIPDFKVVEGKLTVEGGAPAKPIIHDKDGLLLIFDPLGEAYNLYLTKNNVIYLDADHLVIKNMEREQTFTFMDAKAFVYDKASLKELINMFKTPQAYVAGWAIAVIVHAVFILLGFFVHFTIGNLINGLFRRILKPSELFNVMAYSVTLPAFLYMGFVLFYFSSSVVLFLASMAVNGLLLTAMAKQLKEMGA